MPTRIGDSRAGAGDSPGIGALPSAGTPQCRVLPTVIAVFATAATARRGGTQCDIASLLGLECHIASWVGAKSSKIAVWEPGTSLSEVNGSETAIKVGRVRQTGHDMVMIPTLGTTRPYPGARLPNHGSCAPAPRSSVPRPEPPACPTQPCPRPNRTEPSTDPNATSPQGSNVTLLPSESIMDRPASRPRLRTPGAGRGRCSRCGRSSRPGRRASR